MAIRSFLLNSVGEWLDVTLAPRILSECVTRASMGSSMPAAAYQRDLMTLKGFLSGIGMTTIMDAPWSIIFIFVVYMINPVLGFLTVVGLIILVGFGLVNEYATKKPIETATQISRQSQVLADIASRNSEAVESMGMMPNIVKNWMNLNNEAIENSSISSKRANVIQSISRSLRMLVQICCHRSWWLSCATKRTHSWWYDRRIYFGGTCAGTV